MGDFAALCVNVPSDTDVKSVDANDTEPLLMFSVVVAQNHVPSL